MKYYIILYILILNFAICEAQTFSVTITDNNGLMHQLNTFRFTSDSMIVTANSDYGRSNVDYLHRALTTTEKKDLEKFFNHFPADSLHESYFNEYNNFGYIDAENFPRVIELTITKKGKTVHSKATNTYVRLYGRLIDKVNEYLSPEIKIVFDKSKFNAFN